MVAPCVVGRRGDLAASAVRWWTRPMIEDGAPRIERDGDTVRITMTRGAKRNALSREHLTQLLAAVTEVGGSDATGIVLAGEGPVFTAGHAFAEASGKPLPEVRSLLKLCTELMQTV